MTDSNPLDDVHDYLAARIWAPPREIDELTLWAGHTIFADKIGRSPRLIVRSERGPNSGKTVVLNALRSILPGADPASSLTEAYVRAELSQAIGEFLPVFLTDEGDRLLRRDDSVMFKTINGGWESGAAHGLTRTLKSGDVVPVRQAMYCGFAVAGNDMKLPADFMTRSVEIIMRRIPDDQTLAIKSNHNLESQKEAANDLRDTLIAWRKECLDDLTEELILNPPGVPAEVRSRGADLWGSLMVGAVLGGGRWPETCAECARAWARREIERSDVETIPAELELLIDGMRELLKDDALSQREYVSAATILRCAQRIELQGHSGYKWGSQNGDVAYALDRGRATAQMIGSALSLLKVAPLEKRIREPEHPYPKTVYPTEGIWRELAELRHIERMLPMPVKGK